MSWAQNEADDRQLHHETSIVARPKFREEWGSHLNIFECTSLSLVWFSLADTRGGPGGKKEARLRVCLAASSKMATWLSTVVHTHNPTNYVGAACEQLTVSVHIFRGSWVAMPCHRHVVDTVLVEVCQEAPTTLLP